MIRRAKWLATLALGGLIACSGGKGSPGDPPTEPSPAPIADNLPADDSETPPADDQAPPVDDQTPPVDDQATRVDEQRSSSADQADGLERNCTPQGGCVCSNDCERCLCAVEMGEVTADICVAVCGE